MKPSVMPRTFWLLLASLALSACPDDTPATSSGDTSGVQDSVADSPTTSPDTPGDATPDSVGPELPTVDNPHSCRDVGDVTFIPGDPAQCSNSCLDENGKSKKALCPEPVSDWNCVQGCCLPVFTCQTDADCLVYGYGDGGGCDDERFDCRCDVATGTCSNWSCGTDSQCCDDETCSGGACVLRPSSGLAVRIVSAPTTLTTGASTSLAVEVFDPSQPDLALPAEAVTWASDNAAAVDIDSGVATGGTTSGSATITATIEGGASDSVTLDNVVVADGTTLTIITRVEGTTAPIVGTYALVDRAGSVTVDSGDIPADGVISSSAQLPSGGLDVHIFGTDTEWLSYLNAKGPVVLLTAATTVYGKVVLDQDASLIESETALTNTNIVRGFPDFSEYPTDGEFEVSLSSFALSSSLLDFNIDAILGSEVRRYFDPDFPLSGLIDVTQESEIPGGLTFGLEGPAIPDFWLTAPQGSPTLWSLGGRAPASEVTPYIGDIINAVEGDTLDLGRVVTAVIPLFRTFYSAVDTSLAFPGDGATTVTDVAPLLRVPLTLSTELSIPELPQLDSDMWAEVVFMLAGALRADGTFVPMGLNAGADTTSSDNNPADGLADSDDKTPEIDPYTLSYAPMHSGLSTVSGQYAAAVVALSINPGGGSTRRDAGSVLLTRAPLGETLPADSDLPDFLPFATGSSYDAATRTLAVSPPAGSDQTRLLLKGKSGQHWSIWLNGETSYVVPTPDEVTASSGLGDRSTDVELMLVNSFDFAQSVTLDSLTTPGGLSLGQLLLAVDRVSFFDIRP